MASRSYKILTHCFTELFDVRSCVCERELFIEDIHFILDLDFILLSILELLFVFIQLNKKLV